MAKTSNFLGNDEMQLDNRWVNADGTLNELPIVIRYREDWQQAADSGQFGICVQIAWNASSRDDSNAYPAQAEMEQIELLHHQLQNRLESTGNSIVAGSPAPFGIADSGGAGDGGHRLSVFN